MAIRNIVELRQVAEVLCRGGFAGGKTVEQVSCILMIGLELGVGPATAIQNMYMPQAGKVECETGLLLALAQRHPEWKGYKVEWSGSLETKDLCATATVIRDGCPDVSQSMDLARAAAWGWLGKNVWGKDPRLMLENRATAWACRRQFADVLCGVYARGEISEQIKE